MTWGVFPGKEIVQPTIVEAVSFMAWKVSKFFENSIWLKLDTFTQDEAFELGAQWAMLYEHNSPSQKLISDFMDTSFLVNVVHNDFHDPDAIFRPFYKAGAEYLASKPKTIAVNGH